jgi:hypothetical protein
MQVPALVVPGDTEKPVPLETSGQVLGEKSRMRGW